MFDLSENIGIGSSNPGPGRKAKRETDYKSGFPDPARSLSILTALSNELRTNMNVVVAYSYLLTKQEYSDEEKEEFINKIYCSCEQIISLFDNFLDSAIIDTGNSKSEPGICSTLTNMRRS